MKTKKLGSKLSSLIVALLSMGCIIYIKDDVLKTLELGGDQDEETKIFIYIIFTYTILATLFIAIVGIFKTNALKNIQEGGLLTETITGFVVLLILAFFLGVKPELFIPVVTLEILLLSWATTKELKKEKTVVEVIEEET